MERNKELWDCGLYAITLIGLKTAFNMLSMIQTMEYIFVYSTLSVIVILPLVHWYKKDYILGIQNKESAVTCANWFTLYVFLDIFTLKALPLLTKVALSAFLHHDIDLQSISPLSQQSLSCFNFTLSRPLSDRKQPFLLRLIALLAFILLDVFLLDVTAL